MTEPLSTMTRDVDAAACEARREQRRDVALTVGKELERTRLDLGWTPADLVRRYRQPAGPSRYATEFTESTRYNVEFGFGPHRLPLVVNLCWLMAIDPPDLVELVMQQLGLDLHLITLQVDLYAVVADDEYPRLGVVRQWARDRLDRDQNRHGVARVDPAAVARLAAALPSRTEAMQRYLARKRPGSVRGSIAHPGRPDPRAQAPAPVTHEQLAHVLGAEREQARRARGWSPAGLAARLPSASAASVRTHEAGQSLVDVAQLIELGHTLGTPAPRLLGGALRHLADVAGSRLP